MEYLFMFLFFLGGIFLHLDPSPKIFRENDLYRKEWHKFYVGVPLHEKIYYIKNFKNTKIVKELKKGVVYNLLGMSFIFLALLILVLMIFVNTGRF